MHLRGMSAGGVAAMFDAMESCHKPRRTKNVRRHVQGVGGVRGDGGVAAGGFEALAANSGRSVA